MSDLKMALKEFVDWSICGRDRMDHDGQKKWRDARLTLATFLSAPEAAPAALEGGFDPMNDAEFDAALRDHYERSTYELAPEALKKAGESVIADVLAGKDESVAMRAALDYLSTLNATPPAPLTSEEVEAEEPEFTAVRGAWKNSALSKIDRVRAYRAEFGGDIRSALAAVEREMEAQRLASFNESTPPTPAIKASREEIELIVHKVACDAEQNLPKAIATAVDALLALLSSPPAAGEGSVGIKPSADRRELAVAPTSEAVKGVRLESRRADRAGSHLYVIVEYADGTERVAIQEYTEGEDPISHWARIPQPVEHHPIVERQS